MVTAPLLRVLGLQIDHAALGSVSANNDAAAQLIRSHPGYDLYVLPELSSCGYTESALARLDEIAECGRSGYSRAFFSDLARETGAYIAYGIARRRESWEPELAEGRFAICHAVVCPRGELLLLYDKMHVCDMGACSEQAFGFSPGRTLGVFSCKGVNVGVTICYDCRFPELWRALAWDHGCDLILHPSAFVRDATFAMYHPVVTTRAVENGCFVLSVNYAGAEYGSSIAAPPWVGPVPGRNCDVQPVVLGATQAALPLDVDADLLEAVRAAYPYRRNINPALRRASTSVRKDSASVFRR